MQPLGFKAQQSRLKTWDTFKHRVCTGSKCSIITMIECVPARNRQMKKDKNGNLGERC